MIAINEDFATNEFNACTSQRWAVPPYELATPSTKDIVKLV
jgi:hypothetical protein